MLDAMADPKEVFLSALECQSPDELARFLTAACDGDNALRGRVEELLRAHGEAGKFLDGVGRETTTPQGPSVGVGSVVEPYTLVEQIGEGGMGVVFRAEQSVP